MTSIKLLSHRQVKKMDCFASRNERMCYLNRYNSNVLILNEEYRRASSANERFMGYKSYLDEERYYEIMNLADENFYQASKRIRLAC